MKKIIPYPLRAARISLDLNPFGFLCLDLEILIYQRNEKKTVNLFGMRALLGFKLLIDDGCNIMFNFIKPLFCKLPKHEPKVRYNGMNILGYVCESCGYKWYEKKVRTKPDLKLADKN